MFTKELRFCRGATFGGPTYETSLVGKILDKSRPPERRWRYPKPQLFPEISIDTQYSMLKTENWIRRATGSSVNSYSPFALLILPQRVMSLPLGRTASSLSMGKFASRHASIPPLRTFSRSGLKPNSSSNRCADLTLVASACQPQ